MDALWRSFLVFTLIGAAFVFIAPTTDSLHVARVIFWTALCIAIVLFSARRFTLRRLNGNERVNSNAK